MRIKGEGRERGREKGGLEEKEEGGGREGGRREG